MKFSISSAKIVSASSNEHWGGCFVEDGLIILLEIKSKSSHIAARIGKTLFDSLHDKYKSLTVFDKNAIKTLLTSLSGNDSIDTAILGIVSESNLYLGCIGNGRAVLIRNSDTETIVSSGFISSGQISAGDKLVFHSDKLALTLGTEKLKSLFQFDSLEQFEEEAASFLASDEKILGRAILEVAFSSKNKSLKLDSLKLNIPEKLKFKNLKSHIKTKFLNYFQPKTPRQKLTIIILSILLLFLLINTLTGIFKANRSQKLLEINQALSLVSSQYDEAESLVELNPVRSRELLSAAKLTLTKLLSSSKKNSTEYKLLNEWFEKISSTEVAAYKIYKLTGVPVFFDISLIKQGGKGSKLSSYNEKKVILDSANKAVYFLDSKSKQASIIAGSENIKNAKHVGVHSDFAYVLNDEGIFSIEFSSKEVKKVIEADSSWGDIKCLVAFGGNLYLLDSQNNQVWKYVATETGFSEKRSYIGSGVPANFSAVDNLAIDGSVYVAGGKDFIKYSSGSLASFAFKDLGDTITSFDAISTSDAEKYIYILDKLTKRIIVFDKDGLYHAQYQWDELKNANSLVATESEGKIYVLISEKIYAIDIK